MSSQKLSNGSDSVAEAGTSGGGGGFLFEQLGRTANGDSPLIKMVKDANPGSNLKILSSELL
jgi:hypothetical protein